MVGYSSGRISRRVDETANGDGHGDYWKRMNGSLGCGGNSTGTSTQRLSPSCHSALVKLLSLARSSISPNSVESDLMFALSLSRSLHDELKGGVGSRREGEGDLSLCTSSTPCHRSGRAISRDRFQLGSGGSLPFPPLNFKAGRPDSLSVLISLGSYSTRHNVIG